MVQEKNLQQGKHVPKEPQMKEHNHEVCTKTLQAVLEKREESARQQERYPKQVEADQTPRADST